ncbi:signal recognition particle-docking protein FtsY [Corynebacterium sp. TAE3-ERU12]|uniref:signal recognition particle-docking protein FtsY n=1 Tax=Corynebacterium sp. TAE3-ERU12 TaxID=2849491 RepID=UPI001C477179|nr:signal recognition particle-docking protein FtsY [Corynebacterium sp. TAE3-ERU12]MBV7295203.1 signal recognition particle-docking protein FtsY [Corynebacterium sp. TAE3-ERU12]
MNEFLASIDPMWLYVAIGIVVFLILLTILFLVGIYRRKQKTISLTKKDEVGELTQEQKSGNYQAKSDFDFAAGTAAATSAPAEKQPEVLPGQKLDDQPPVQKPQPQAKPQPEPKPEVGSVDEPVIKEGPADKPEPKQAAVEPSEHADDDVSATTPTEPVDAAEPTEPTEPVEPAAPTEPEAPAEPAPAEPEAPADDTASPDTAISTAPDEPLDDIAPTEGRLGKLRGRLSRSQNAIGESVLGIMGAGDLDEESWEEIEDTLLMADLGTPSTMSVVDKLRERIASRNVSTEEEVRALLREVLIEECQPDLNRSIHALPQDGKPAVVLVVGVNGTGKTTTAGKLARVLVAQGHKVVLGAADTFRAAAADQLETWGRRVGADTVRGKEGADPASVAFDAVAKGVEQGADVVLIDTAGRLHTSTGLMDQLGKVKRVVEKKAVVDEVLLVLDATVGQNGLTQARVFRDVVDITGAALTKLDGTAKGGIVFQVQHELGVPVKLVGLGEGADHLAPFEPESFVDALLGE